MGGRDDCPNSPVLPILLSIKPHILRWNYNCSPVSSLNPSPVLLRAHSAPVTSWSSNMPGILPPRDLCSCCSFCLECSFPGNLH